MTDPVHGALSEGRRTAILYAIPLFLAALAALLPIDGKFVFDDHLAIQSNRFVIGTEPYWRSIFYDVWGNPISGSITTWRPLVPIFWKFLWGLFPDNPLPFRILTLALHMGAVAAMIWLFRGRLEDDVLLAAACIFAVHPIHSEAIGGIVSHADILAALLGMLSIVVALRRSGYSGVAFSLLLLTLACLIKEISIIYGIVLIILRAVRDVDSRRKAFAIALTTTFMLAFIILQSTFIRKGVDQPTTWSYNIAYAFHGFDRVLYGFYSLGKSVSMLFVPAGLSPYHGYAAVAPQAAGLLPMAAFGLLCLLAGVAGLALAIRKRNVAWILILSLLYGPCLFQSHLFFRTVAAFPERLLYPASIAASILIAWALRRVIANSKAFQAAILVILISFSAQSWIAERPWRDDLALQTFAVSQQPLDWRAHYIYGNISIDYGRRMEGAWHIALANFLVKQFPREANTQPLEKFGDMSLEDRVLRAPSILQPDSPCTMALEILGTVKGDAPLYDTLRSKYRAFYGQCVEDGCLTVLRETRGGQFILLGGTNR